MSKRSPNVIYYGVNGSKSHGICLFNEDLDGFLYHEDNYLQADIYRISTSLFELEKKFIEDGVNVKKIGIPITRKTIKEINSEEIENKLSPIFKFITGKSVVFKLFTYDFKPPRIQIKNVSGNYDCICLFSGGADSLVGVNYSLNKFKKSACVYARHINYGNLKLTIDYLESNFLKPNKTDLYRIDAPKHPKGYSQVRGLLYILFSSIFASLFNSKKIIMSECGPTMYQPKFGSLDEITYTSHPVVIETSQDIINSFFNKKIDILTPFENNTKAEMLTMFPIQNHLKRSHSCVTCRWVKNGFPSNCGACYGCIIRRLSFLIAGIDEFPYMNDILIENDHKKAGMGRGITTIGKKSGRLLALMRFCFDILFDYDNMPDFSKERIDTFDKKDLFERFALDNLAAIYMIYEKNKIGKNKLVDKLYWNIRDYISKENLEERLHQLRNNKVKTI